MGDNLYTQVKRHSFSEHALTLSFYKFIIEHHHYRTHALRY